MLMAADLTKSGFLGVGPQSRIYARGSSFNGRFFLKLQHEYQKFPELNARRQQYEKPARSGSNYFLKAK